MSGQPVDSTDSVARPPASSSRSRQLRTGRHPHDAETLLAEEDRLAAGKGSGTATMRCTILVVGVVATMMVWLSPAPVAPSPPEQRGSSGTTAAPIALEDRSGSELEQDRRRRLDTAPPAAPVDPVATSAVVDTSGARSGDAPLTAPLTATQSEREWKAEYQRQFRAFGAAKRAEFLHWLVANHRGRGIPLWRPGRARPIVCDGGRAIYAGYYSIPSALMVRGGLPEKKYDWSVVVPALKKTYRYSASQEAEYTQNMRESRFGITFRKGGWQSARTLEIFAAGSVPYFCDIWESPKEGTVANFPREALVAMLGFPGVSVRCFPKQKFSRRDFDHVGVFNDTLYNAVAEMIRRYAEEVLTAPYIARYTLSATSLTAVPRKVLVVWCTHPLHPGYLVPTLMMGMKELGVTVVDFPRQDIIYEDKGNAWGCKAKAGKSWGRGYFSFCRVPESDEEVRERGRVSEALARREFDIVIFHIPHESYAYESNTTPPRSKVHLFPFYNETKALYPKDRVLVIHDGDLLYEQKRDNGYDAFADVGRYMRRESHGCSDGIWAPRSWWKHLPPSAATPEDDIFP